MNNAYIHKKTNKLYTLVCDNFMFKQDGEWIKNLVLYHAEYYNPDGQYFARTKEDFFENFEKSPDAGATWKVKEHVVYQAIKAEVFRYISDRIKEDITWIPKANDLYLCSDEINKLKIEGVTDFDQILNVIRQEFTIFKNFRSNKL